MRRHASNQLATFLLTSGTAERYKDTPALLTPETTCGQSSAGGQGAPTAVPAGDGSPAVDVVFDAEGAAAFSKAASEVAQDGDGARLVLRVHDQVLSAVRVPSPISVTTMRIAVPDHLHADDVARQIHGG